MPDPAPSPAPGRLRDLALVVLTTIAMKLCVILAPPDALLPTGLGVGEELFRGVAAQEFLDGPVMPWMDYQINHFSGGSLVVALLAVPSFVVFGATTIAMRLVTVLFSVLAVVCLFAILDRFHGRRAALVGSLLLAFCPPGYAIVSGTAWGTHLEGNALMMALAWLFLRFHSSGARRSNDDLHSSESEPANGSSAGRRASTAFAMGVLGGFAVYFGYVAIVIVGALVATEFLVARRHLAWRWYGWRVAGFALGFSPWLVYNVANDFAGLSLYGQSLGGHLEHEASATEMANAARDLVTTELPKSFFFDGFLGEHGAVIEQGLYVALLALIALAALVALIQRRERARAGIQPLALALVYAVLFAVAYAGSDFRAEPGKGQVPEAQHFRYAMPLVPWLFLATGVAVGALARRGRVLGRLATGVAGVAMGVSAIGTLAACDFGRASETWGEPGHSDVVLGRTIAMRYATDPDALERIARNVLEGRPEERQHQILFVVGQNLKVFVHPKTKARKNQPPREAYEPSIDRLHEILPEAFAPYFERPVPGERIYAPWTPELRAKFWADREARARGAGAKAKGGGRGKAPAEGLDRADGAQQPAAGRAASEPPVDGSPADGPSTEGPSANEPALDRVESETAGDSNSPAAGSIEPSATSRDATEAKESAGSAPSSPPAAGADASDEPSTPPANPANPANGG